MGFLKVIKRLWQRLEPNFHFCQWAIRNEDTRGQDEDGGDDGSLLLVSSSATFRIPISTFNLSPHLRSYFFFLRTNPGEWFPFLRDWSPQSFAFQVSGHTYWQLVRETFQISPRGIERKPVHLVLLCSLCNGFGVRCADELFISLRNPWIKTFLF